MFLYCPWHDVVLVFCHAFFIQRIEWYYVSVGYVGHRLIKSPLISDQPMFDSACPKCCWIWLCSQSLNSKVLSWFLCFHDLIWWWSLCLGLIPWPDLFRICCVWIYFQNLNWSCFPHNCLLHTMLRVIMLVLVMTSLVFGHFTVGSSFASQYVVYLLWNIILWDFASD